jgi:hypothetical protein
MQDGSITFLACCVIDRPDEWSIFQMRQTERTPSVHCNYPLRPVFAAISLSFNLFGKLSPLLSHVNQHGLVIRIV